MGNVKGQSLDWTTQTREYNFTLPVAVYNAMAVEAGKLDVTVDDYIIYLYMRNVGKCTDG